MNQHLNNDEFAQCVAFGPANGMALHLSECTACSAELERMRVLLGDFGQAVRASAERDGWFWQRQRAHVRERIAAASAPRLHWALAGVVAVAIAAVALLESTPLKSRRFAYWQPEPGAQVATAVAVPRIPQAQVSATASDDAADDALLSAIQQDMARETPQALAAMAPLEEQITGRKAAVQQGEKND